jgi:hypothetical protein
MAGAPREDWNKWLAKYPQITLDLSKADLSGADLTNAALSRANFTEADLSGANLSGANLVQADILKANLWCARLNEANLAGAFLNNSAFIGADFTRANLRLAKLIGADLHQANLMGADLTGALCLRANLMGADLTGANLDNAELSETNFAGATLRDAKGLAECDFHGPCILDIRAIQQSGMLLPEPFLHGCGFPDSLIKHLRPLLSEPHYYSCFISHSHDDKPFVRRLFDVLSGRGVWCYLDDEQMLPGDDIHDQEDRGIRRFDKFLLCCSKNSLTSWHVDSEINRAFEKERILMKERGRKTPLLIPIALDGYLQSGQWQSGKAPEVLSRLVADFRGWDGRHEIFESAVEKVILALRTDEGARPPAPISKL